MLNLNKAAARVCQYRRTFGEGCSDPLAAAGSCGNCRKPLELVFAMGDSAIADPGPLSASGGCCMICKRQTVRGLLYKGRPVCTTCAPYSGQGEIMLTFTETEEEAIEVGGRDAGGFLDSIDKTDLADLTEEQWRKFLGKFLLGYSEFMRAEAAKYPPF